MIIKLQPIFFDKVWGGEKLKTTYHYNCSNTTGEAWGISGHNNGSSIVLNGIYKGKTLRELYHEHPELFGYYKSEEFPLLIKLIHAKQDLSIQVHPDNEYAKTHENSLGKTECWYILDTEENTDIIIGHTAKNKDEMQSHITDNTVETVLNRFSINKGDTFEIQAGTIHAICSGTLLLEIQQSSDVTYRVYDYNRLSNGSLRELHINQALDVISFPSSMVSHDTSTKYFEYTVKVNDNHKEKQSDTFGDYIFIVEGEGSIENELVKKGDFIFVPSDTRYTISGPIEYVLSTIK